MSDENTQNMQTSDKQSPVPQEKSQNNSQVSPPPETKQTNLSEAVIKNAGDQGVFFNPAVGVNTPDPFVSQDATQTQPPPAQTVTPPAQSITPSAQTGGGDNSGGEE
ncbi:MAG: hypothetical protein HYZ21_05490 [Chloroflexi bacterium]|nr:hypothetical protein [Chloroflexota bacterium]